MSYECVKGSEVIATNFDPWLVGHLERLEFASVGELFPSIVHPEIDSPDEGLENIADHPSYLQRVPLSAHGCSDQ